MEAVWIKLLNISITATWIVLAVILLRPLLKKAPKAVTVFLWALVGARLILPFSIESPISLIPSAETVPSDIGLAQTPTIESGVPAINNAINPGLSQSMAPVPHASANPMQTLLGVAAVIWVIGIGAMLLYGVISYLHIRLKVREAVPEMGNVMLCDNIGSPFILGLIRPRIYLPVTVNEADKLYVLAHERAHLKRLDHLWKPLGFLLLTVYWFNPALWVAYILFCRDIELACDEKVIKSMGTDAKKPYSEALINCSVTRRSVAACPLAFGEVGVKQRIKSVLNYKRPAFWLILLAILLCAGLTVCFLTVPLSRDASEVIWQDGYRIVEQYESPLYLTLNRANLPAELKDGETYTFQKNQVTVWSDGSNTLYLESIRPGSMNSKDYVYLSFFFDFDIGDSGFIPTVYSVNHSDGVTHSVGSATLTLMSLTDKTGSSLSDLGYVDGVFPSGEKSGQGFGVWIKRDYCLSQWESLSLYITGCHQLEYVKTKQYDDYMSERKTGLTSGIVDQFTYYDHTVLDVDADGQVELCYLMPGPASGINSFQIVVWQASEIEYYSWWALNMGWDSSFVKSESGALQIRAASDHTDEATIRFYDLTVEEGALQLYENGVRLASNVVFPEQ